MDTHPLFENFLGKTIGSCDLSAVFHWALALCRVLFQKLIDFVRAAYFDPPLARGSDLTHFIQKFVYNLVASPFVIVTHLNNCRGAFHASNVHVRPSTSVLGFHDWKTDWLLVRGHFHSKLFGVELGLGIGKSLALLCGSGARNENLHLSLFLVCRGIIGRLDTAPI